MPERADDTAPGKRESADVRAQRFGAYLRHQMQERGISNSDMVKGINHPTYDSAAVSNWTKGRQAPSELAAWLFADALGDDPARVLRIAGFPEIAAQIEKIAPERDPVLDILDSLDMPGLTAPIAAEYQRALRAARRAAQLEIAELRRTLQPSQDEETPRSAAQ